MKWQRWARLLIALFAVGFTVALALAFRPRVAGVRPAGEGLTDPNAVVESTSGRAWKVRRAREDVNVEYDRQLTYKDGSTRLLGVKIVTTERSGARTFTVTAKEGFVGQNESVFTVIGDVQMIASDGLTAKIERALYDEGDGTVRAPGPVEFTRRRLSGTGVGMTYDKNQDVLVILDQAHILMQGGAGGVATEVTAPTATLARHDRYLRFDHGSRTKRSGQVIESDSTVAHLSEDGERVESVELRQNAKITASNAQPGALESLTGRDMDLKYAAGEVLERAVIRGDATLHVAGSAGSASRQLTATTL